jgi:hypothetical protein
MDTGNNYPAVFICAVYHERLDAHKLMGKSLEGMLLFHDLIHTCTNQPVFSAAHIAQTAQTYVVCSDQCGADAVVFFHVV